MKNSKLTDLSVQLATIVFRKGNTLPGRLPTDVLLPCRRCVSECYNSNLVIMMYALSCMINTEEHVCVTAALLTAAFFLFHTFSMVVAFHSWESKSFQQAGLVSILHLLAALLVSFGGFTKGSIL